MLPHTWRGPHTSFPSTAVLGQQLNEGTEWRFRRELSQPSGTSANLSFSIGCFLGLPIGAGLCFESSKSGEKLKKSEKKQPLQAGARNSLGLTYLPIP